MAEVNNFDEPLLPTKRTPDQITHEDDSNCPKKHKLGPNNGGDTHPEQQQTTTQDDTIHAGKNSETLDEETRKEQEQEQEQEQEEKQAEEEEEKNANNGEVVIDRKGKGILIEEDDDEEDEDDDDDDDDDDSDDDDDDSDGDVGGNLSDDSDFVEDPLAEVDLDNILPSRTRRKSIQPGAYIANDLPDEDSDESDDPDA